MIKIDGELKYTSPTEAKTENVENASRINSPHQTLNHYTQRKTGVCPAFFFILIFFSSRENTMKKGIYVNGKPALPQVLTAMKNMVTHHKLFQ